MEVHLAALRSRRGLQGQVPSLKVKDVWAIRIVQSHPDPKRTGRLGAVRNHRSDEGYGCSLDLYGRTASRRLSSFRQHFREARREVEQQIPYITRAKREIIALLPAQCRLDTLHRQIRRGAHCIVTAITSRTRRFDASTDIVAQSQLRFNVARSTVFAPNSHDHRT